MNFKNIRDLNYKKNVVFQHYANIITDNFSTIINL